DADFILESIPEDLEQKLDTYEVIEEVVSDQTIISSNTSTFPLEELTQRAKRPERFIITHFFNPPQLVPIVEVVKCKHKEEHIVKKMYDISDKIVNTLVVLK